MAQNGIVEFIGRDPYDQFLNLTGTAKVGASSKYTGLWFEGELLAGTNWTVINSTLYYLEINGQRSLPFVECQCHCGSLPQWKRTYDVLNGRLGKSCMGCKGPNAAKRSVSPAPTVKSKKAMQDQKREKQMATAFKLIWNSDTNGHDAETPSGNIVELKSCGNGKCFALGRHIIPSKVDEYESEYWGFSFYSSIRTDARRGDSYFIHPTGLNEKWAKLRQNSSNIPRVILSSFFSTTQFHLYTHTQEDV